LKSVSLAYPPEQAFQELADCSGWGKYGFQISPSKVVEVVSQACKTMNKMCAQLAWIEQRGYAGTKVSLTLARNSAKKGCQFGDFVGCVNYYYLREREPLPPDSPLPPFADLNSRKFYTDLLKKMETEKFDFSDVAKHQSKLHFSKTHERYSNDFESTEAPRCPMGHS